MGPHALVGAEHREAGGQVTFSGRWRARTVRLLLLERGALLWMTAIVSAALFLLWAMRVVPSPSARYTEARELLLILGPLDSPATEPLLGDAVRVALRDALQNQREFALVPESAVQRRVQALRPGAHEDALSWIRATRSLKARYYLTGQVERMPQGALQVRLGVWETARELSRDAVNVQAATPQSLARALADTLGVVLFEPSLQQNAQR